ncbi:hypothetical protein ACFV6Z_24395 [Streptomyces sp. NPDC059818]|uniref:8-oxoguanine DNA glycosylase OGG fold protein n=1 Tax=Streptomyces sp. NPDC059818 TaxID=3346962 RepID=UPI00364E0255
MRFRPETWRPWLEPHGDRLISRDDLAAIRERAGDDPDGLRDLFVAVMVWGSGATDGCGPWRTDAALSDVRIRSVLRTTCASVRSGDLSAAAPSPTGP